MRKSGSMVIVLAMALIACGFGAQALADTTTEISELEHKCAAATTAEQALACFTSNEDVTIYDLTPPREFAGQKAVRADFEGAFANFKNTKVDFISLHVIPSPKLAVATSVQHMTATDNAGKPLDFIFRVTDVWRKEKDGWKIAHAHISFPTDMATGKADMQSK